TVHTSRGAARGQGEDAGGLAAVTSVAQTFLQLGAAELLHAAVRQADVALLLVLVIGPADRRVVGREGGAQRPELGRGVGGRRRRATDGAATADVMIPSQVHLGVGVLSVHAHEVAAVQVIGEGDVVGARDEARSEAAGLGAGRVKLGRAIGHL